MKCKETDFKAFITCRKLLQLLGESKKNSKECSWCSCLEINRFLYLMSWNVNRRTSMHLLQTGNSFNCSGELKKNSKECSWCSCLEINRFGNQETTCKILHFRSHVIELPTGCRNRIGKTNYWGVNFRRSDWLNAVEKKWRSLSATRVYF